MDGENPERRRVDCSCGETYYTYGNVPERHRSCAPVEVGLVMTDRMQEVDCYWCEDGTPHRHEPPEPEAAGAVDA